MKTHMVLSRNETTLLLRGRRMWTVGELSQSWNYHGLTIAGHHGKISHHCFITNLFPFFLPPESGIERFSTTWLWYRRTTEHSVVGRSSCAWRKQPQSFRSSGEASLLGVFTESDWRRSGDKRRKEEKRKKKGAVSSLHHSPACAFLGVGLKAFISGYSWTSDFGNLCCFC